MRWRRGRSDTVYSVYVKEVFPESKFADVSVCAVTSHLTTPGSTMPFPRPPVSRGRSSSLPCALRQCLPTTSSTP